MTKIYLVRHGKAAAAFDEDHDPPLDKTGIRQALAMADTLGPLGPLPMLTSPMRRTRETISALEAVWGSPARIEPRVTEVPSPTEDLGARRKWLTGIMAGNWTDEGALHLAGWRAALLDVLEGIETDTVISSHFVAINTIVGLLTSDDRVTIFRPDNCSITRIERQDGRLVVAEMGREVETEVL